MVPYIVRRKLMFRKFRKLVRARATIQNQVCLPIWCKTFSLHHSPSSRSQMASGISPNLTSVSFFICKMRVLIGWIWIMIIYCIFQKSYKEGFGMFSPQRSDKHLRRYACLPWLEHYIIYTLLKHHLRPHKSEYILCVKEMRNLHPDIP